MTFAFLSQCIITMPDGVVSPRDFTQVMEDGEMNLAVNHGNTVVFDSFTPEEVVRQRNLRNNNVSKLNQMPHRFANEFSVRVSAVSITAILCADTVADYRIIDKRAKKELTASDKRPDYMKAHQEEILTVAAAAGNNNNNNSGKGVKRQRNETTASPPPAAAASEEVFLQTPPPRQPPVAPRCLVPPPPSSMMMMPPYSYNHPPPFQHGGYYGYHHHQPQQQHVFNARAFDHPGIPGFMAGPSFRSEINMDVVSSLAGLSRVCAAIPPSTLQCATASTATQPSLLLLNPRQLKQGDIIMAESGAGESNDGNDSSSSSISVSGFIGGNTDDDDDEDNEDSSSAAAVGSSPVKPFPFRSKEPPTIEEPIFDETTLLASHQMSDSIRAAVSINDLLRPSPILADEMQRCSAAAALQSLSSDLTAAAAATTAKQ